MVFGLCPTLLHSAAAALPAHASVPFVLLFLFACVTCVLNESTIAIVMAVKGIWKRHLVAAPLNSAVAPSCSQSVPIPVVGTYIQTVIHYSLSALVCVVLLDRTVATLQCPKFLLTATGNGDRRKESRPPKSCRTLHHRCNILHRYLATVTAHSKKDGQAIVRRCMRVHNRLPLSLSLPHGASRLNVDCEELKKRGYKCAA